MSSQILVALLLLLASCSSPASGTNDVAQFDPEAMWANMSAASANVTNMSAKLSPDVDRALLTRRFEVWQFQASRFASLAAGKPTQAELRAAAIPLVAAYNAFRDDYNRMAADQHEPPMAQAQKVDPNVPIELHGEETEMMRMGVRWKG